MSTNGNSAARILDAALTLFSERGYQATSTREICELAQITKPTLYYFYKSKEGVYRALIEQADQEFQTVLRNGLASPGTLRDRYKNVVEMMFEATLRQERLARFMFSVTWAPNMPFVAEMHKLYEGAVRLMAEAASEAVEKGEIRPGNPEVQMTVLMGCIMESISNFLIMGTPKLTRKLAHQLIDMVFDGWQPAETKARR